jgi:hypothetical protein
MEILLFFCLLSSIFVTLRLFGETIRQWDGYVYRKYTIIERINKFQQKVDILVGVYLTITLVLWIFIMLSIISMLFNVTFNSLFFTIIPYIIIVSYLIYHILCYNFEKKYDITSFYHNMVDYRKKQEVVMEDNDDEVSYIRVCEKYLKHKKRVIPIVIFFIMYVILIRNYIL